MTGKGGPANRRAGPEGRKGRVPDGPDPDGGATGKERTPPGHVDLYGLGDPLDNICVDGRPRTWREAVRNITIPFAIPGLVVAVLYFALEENLFWTLAFWSLVYLFPPLGKESVIPLALAGEREGISWLAVDIPGEFVAVPAGYIIAMITLIDACAGLFIILNFDAAKRIPLLGQYICRIESSGDRIFDEKPWLENLATIGIVLFVMFPFQGSGGITASIIGRAMGMNKTKLLMGITAGAFLGATIIAFLGSAFIALFQRSWVMGLVALVALVLGFAVAYFLYRRRNQEMRAKRGGGRGGEGGKDRPGPGKKQKP